jgi:Tfp pilus assembly protein PilV
MTLVEVLVAVVICGAALTIAAGGIAAALRADDAADDLARASSCMRLLLARLESGAVALEAGTGDFADDGEPGFTWEVTVEPGEVEGLTDCHLAVRWTRFNQERELDVSRLLFVDPQQADTSTQ